MNSKLFAAPIDWLRKNLEIDEDELYTNNHHGKRKENRSQSLMVKGSSNHSKKLYTQHSLDCSQLLKESSYFEEEEVKLEGTSNILGEGDVKFIGENLPSRLLLSDWYQVFSTGKTLYRLCVKRLSMFKAALVMT